LADDATWELPCVSPESFPLAGVHHKAAFLEILADFSGIFPQGVNYRITGMTAGADRAAVEAECHTPPDGPQFHNRYHFLFEFRDGKVCAGKETWVSPTRRRSSAHSQDI
jgi:hypothetical protein